MGRIVEKTGYEYSFVILFATLSDIITLQVKYI